MKVTLVGMMTLAKLQPSNALPSISVTEVGILIAATR